MRSKQFTVEEILWIHSKTKAGLHPLKLKITYNKKTKYYPIQLEGKNIYLSQAQWKSINERNVRGQTKQIREAIEGIKVKARDCIEKATSGHRSSFTFIRFEKEFILNTSSRGLIAFFEEYLSEILKEGRAGTYHTYHCALQSFKEFRKGRDLDPLDLTPDLLKQFEGFLKEEKATVTATGKVTTRKAGKTTISIYMRALRAVYNFTAGKLPYLREHYPFTVHQSDRSKYKIRNGSGSKGDALTVDQLKQFVELDVIQSSPEWKAKNLWLFSFFCNGMNFNDIARLKYSSIKKDSIQYVRQKTKDTEGHEEIIEIPLNDQIREILIEMGNPQKRSDHYVFDFLLPGMNPVQERLAINQRIKIVNKWLERLCSANDLPRITTYWARHSYASLLKQSGQSVELIREMLGHSDIKTTESYLKRFDLVKKKAANDVVRLLVMKKIS